MSIETVCISFLCTMSLFRDLITPWSREVERLAVSDNRSSWRLHYSRIGTSVSFGRPHEIVYVNSFLRKPYISSASVAAEPQVTSDVIRLVYLESLMNMCQV